MSFTATHPDGLTPRDTEPCPERGCILGAHPLTPDAHVTYGPNHTRTDRSEE